MVLTLSFSPWELLAGLTLFLLAMSQIEDTIRTLAGQRFKHLIVENTQTPLRGILTGTVATAILQSSSLVTLMLLALVGARIMPMRNALAVVIGANLGTTATGWIVATIGFKLDLESVALPLVACGGLITAMMQGQRWRTVGQFTMGLGLLLLGLQYMKGAMGDVSSAVPTDLLVQFNSLEFLLFGALMSALVQSSSAVMVIALSAINGGILDIGSAAALAIGADLGTTSTVILGAIRGSASKKRVALGHLVFNLVTDVVAFILLTPLLALTLPLGDPVMRLVAFHSMFNLLGIFLFAPFTGALANFLNRRFVDSNDVISRHLGEAPIELPEAGLSSLWQELRHLLVQVHLRNQMALELEKPTVLSVARDYDLGDEDDPARAYARSKELEGEMVQYAIELRDAQLTTEQHSAIDAMTKASRSALQSAKFCNDLRNDAQLLESVLPRLSQQAARAQQALYAQFGRVLDEEDSFRLQDAELVEQIEQDHETFHELIYEAIKAGQISDKEVSALLNWNRALYNSNTSMLSALTTLVITAPIVSEAFSELPHAAVA